jgi:hypothetical protein
VKSARLPDQNQKKNFLRKINFSKKREFAFYKSIKNERFIFSILID